MQTKTIYVFDPTKTDELSKVRGVGRYVQTMHDYLTPEFNFTDNLKAIKNDSIFINPFFSHLKAPLKLFGRVAKTQIAVIHDLIPLKYPQAFPIGIKGNIFKRINNWKLNSYDLIVTDSFESKKSIMALLKIPEAKIQVIYPTVSKVFIPHIDTSQESVEQHHPFHKETGHSKAEFTPLAQPTFTSTALAGVKDYILYVGDATWNKNLLNLAQAVHIANLTCVCVGKTFAQTDSNGASFKPHPWQTSLYAFLKQIEKDKRFILPGYVSDIELFELYKKARVNVLLSFDEGFGFSYIESGYASTPSVLSDIPVFKEIAKNCAAYTDPNDPNVIAEKLNEVFFDSVLREKMSINAFERAQDFSPELFRKNWLSITTKI